MNELEHLLQDIERLRSQLYKLIKDKSKNLNDPEIISASQILNAAITKYNNFIDTKINK